MTSFEGAASPSLPVLSDREEVAQVQVEGVLVIEEYEKHRRDSGRGRGRGLRSVQGKPQRWHRASSLLYRLPASNVDTTDTPSTTTGTGHSSGGFDVSGCACTCAELFHSCFEDFPLQTDSVSAAPSTSLISAIYHTTQLARARHWCSSVTLVPAGVLAKVPDRPIHSRMSMSFWSSDAAAHKLTTSM